MSKIGALRDLLLALLHEHERDGMFPTNARFLFYELVQRGHVSKEETGARRADQDMGDALKDIRDDGQIPWNWLVDETRSIDDYTGIAASARRARLPAAYQTRPLARRPPMILTESRSLAGVLRHVAREYRAASPRPTDKSAGSSTPMSPRSYGRVPRALAGRLRPVGRSDRG